MVAPIIYRSDDASAPSLTGEVGSLIALLDAILVNGYGAKAAAGWSKAFSGTNKAAYRQAAGAQRYLRVQDDGTVDAADVAVARAYDTMTDVDTGTNPFPTAVEMADGVYVPKASSTGTTVRAWIAFATGQSLLLVAYPGVSGAPVPSTRQTYAAVLFFADIETNVVGDAYDTLLVGHSSSTHSATATFESIGLSTAFVADPAHYLAGSFSQVAGSVGVEKGSMDGWSQSYLSAGGGGPYPDPASGYLNMSKIGIFEADLKLRGHLAGIWNMAHSFDDIGGQNTFSGTGDLAGETFLTVPMDNSGVAIQTSGGWI